MLQARKLSEAGWECIHFCEVDAIHGFEDVRSAGFRVFEMDADEVTSEQRLFTSVAEAMSFPDYFGRNWDALDECLRDMGWSPATGFVLLVRNAEHLWRRHPRIAGGFLQSWLFSAEEWSQKNIPFHLIFVW
jgi:RNAse (barnase) inhibitor barstar